MSKLIVQKYGGATIADPEKIKAVAHQINQLHKSGSKLVVIVSAMGQTTNQLIQLAHQVSASPQLREFDMLLTAGERISMSLLSMALNDLGCPAISFTGSQAGILTDDSHINAKIIDVKAFRVKEALSKNKVVILAGFQGISQNTKEITTLGRGGSDITAVAIAGYLQADRCEILKDVDCVYSADPKLVKSAYPIRHLNYDLLLEMTSWGAKVLHHQSVKLAAEKNVHLYVGPASSLNNKIETSNGTLVSQSFNYEKQQALALNSFAHIIKINFLSKSENHETFLKYLSQNQIGQPQFVFKNKENYYFSGPKEILKSIIDFEPHNSFYKVAKSELCSISICFSKKLTGDQKNTCSNILNSHQINFLETFESSYSQHFIIEEKDLNRSTEFLHELIIRT